MRAHNGRKELALTIKYCRRNYTKFESKSANDFIFLGEYLNDKK